MMTALIYKAKIVKNKLLIIGQSYSLFSFNTKLKIQILDGL